MNVWTVRKLRFRAVEEDGAEVATVMVVGEEEKEAAGMIAAGAVGEVERADPLPLRRLND